MDEIYVKRDWQNHLIPSDEYSLEIVQKFKKDAPKLITVKGKRNLEFHQKYFVMLQVIYEIQNHFDNFEAMRYWITMKAGYYDTIMAPNGNLIYQPKSVSFAKMDEIEFQKVYDGVIQVALVHKDICGGITKEDLLKEAESKIMQFT